MATNNGTIPRLPLITLPRNVRPRDRTAQQHFKMASHVISPIIRTIFKHGGGIIRYVVCHGLVHRPTMQQRRLPSRDLAEGYFLKTPGKGRSSPVALGVNSPPTPRGWLSMFAFVRTVYRQHHRRLLVGNLSTEGWNNSSSSWYQQQRFLLIYVIPKLCLIRKISSQKIEC